MKKWQSVENIFPKMSIFHKYFHGNAHNSVIFQYFFNPFFPVHCRGSCASFVWLESFFRHFVQKILKKEKQFPSKNGFFHPIIKPPRLNHSFYGHASFIKISCICSSDSDVTFEFSLSCLWPALWPQLFFPTIFSIFSEKFKLKVKILAENPRNE